ncbi:hypothetical protein JCM11491_000082 [Sporobolomyces phaffii]
MTTQHVTVFAHEIDTSKGPFSRAISLSAPGLGSTSFNLSFSERPCQCATTIVCIPIVATLELSWKGFAGGKGLAIRKGSLSFEREAAAGGTGKKDRASIAIEAPGTFPERESGSVKVSSFVTAGRGRIVTAKFELEVEPEHEATSLTRTLDLIDGRARPDVCLVFPREGGRHLFASAQLLAEASPYWQARLSTAGFNEGLLEALDLSDDEAELDSDLELEDEDNENLGPAMKPLPIPDGVRAIPIYGTAYSTYRALLAYFYTGEISFAPLSNTFPSRACRRSSISLSRALGPSSSLSPVSPKSLYVLSHFLSIPTLSHLALEHYVSTLTLDTAFDEIHSTFVETYDDVRDRVVGWLLEEGKDRWSTLCRSEKATAWRDGIRARGGPTETEMEILFKLSGI